MHAPIKPSGSSNSTHPKYAHIRQGKQHPACGGASSSNLSLCPKARVRRSLQSQRDLRCSNSFSGKESDHQVDLMQADQRSESKARKGCCARCTRHHRTRSAGAALLCSGKHARSARHSWRRDGRHAQRRGLPGRAWTGAAQSCASQAPAHPAAFSPDKSRTASRVCPTTANTGAALLDYMGLACSG